MNWVEVKVPPYFVLLWFYDSDTAAGEDCEEMIDEDLKAA